MGITHCRRNVRVPQKLLYGLNGDPILSQMGGKGVSELMPANFAQVGLSTGLIEFLAAVMLSEMGFVSGKDKAVAFSSFD